VTGNLAASAPVIVNIVTSSAVALPNSTGPTGTGNLTVPNGGGVSLKTPDTASLSQVTVLHARLQELSGNEPTGVAMFGLRSNGVLVTEAGVPASAQISSGRIYAEVHGTVNTGIALANESANDAAISYYFTDPTTGDTGAGSFTLPAGHQIAAFLNQPPFNGPADIQGTFTFTSSTPIGAIALRGLTNERNDFLITTLPVSTLDTIGGPAVLPHFADGGGWTTQVILTNNSENTLSGVVQFFSPGSDSQSGQPIILTINGVSASTVPYTIPAHGMARLVTSGSSTTTQVGWVQISAANGTGSINPVPAAVSIFSFQNRGITVTQASVLALPLGTGFRTYLETSNGSGLTGPTQSGVAIANPSSSPATVTIQLTNLDGTPLGFTQSVTVPAGGQVAKFINELFPQLSANFQGVGRVTSSSAVALAALRGRFNERGDFLVTTTPTLNEAVAPSMDLVFPHIVSGMGYVTQTVVFGTGGTARLYLLGQDGTLRSMSALAP
jgi:hypothetical protein